jgi:hypothetical protein
VTKKRWEPGMANLGHIYDKWNVMKGNYQEFDGMSCSEAWVHVFGRELFDRYLETRTRQIWLLKLERDRLLKLERDRARANR